MRGWVSATDILEALVGELPDEIPHGHNMVQRADGSWLVDGSLPVKDLKGLLHARELPGEETGNFHGWKASRQGLVVPHRAGSDED